MYDIVFNQFLGNYLLIKPKCDALKLELGERWDLMYKHFIPFLEEYSKDNLCQTKIEAIVGLSIKVDSEMDLIFAYSCINENDIELFKSHLQNPIVTEKYWSSNGS